MVDLPFAVRAASIERRAISAVGVAIVLWSGSALFVRAGHADALAFTTWRLWLAVPALTLLAAIRARRGDVVRWQAAGVSRAKWVAVVAGAGFFFAAGAATAFAALGQTRLLDVSLIGALQPVLIIALAVAFLGERTDRATVVRAVVAVIGTAIVAISASGSGNWSLAGDLLAVASLFLNVGWYLYGRVLRDRYGVDPLGFMLVVLFAAALWLTPLALMSEGLALTPSAFGYATATMVVGTTGHLLVVWAHRFIPASVSAPLLLAQPPIVAVAAWACFGEAPGPWEVVGSAIVVWALFAMVRNPALEHVEHDLPDPAPPT